MLSRILSSALMTLRKAPSASTSAALRLVGPPKSRAMLRPDMELLKASVL